jgi:uncharacterized protein (DUF934 family)
MPDASARPARIIQGSLGEGGHVVDDPWTTVTDIDALRALPDDVPVIVPLALWSADRDALLVHRGAMGVLLAPDDDPADIADDLGQFELIAVDFPRFTDGRGYSIARLLRERYGYAGPLRAVGDVLRDQLFYMLRCGFDAFAMKHDDHVDAALSAYRDFSDAYQTAADRKEPLFRRRLTERAAS